MKYGGIKEFDIANGSGLRTSLFVSGCNLHCKGCFNNELQDFNYGKEYTDETEQYILSTLTEHISGLSILGGDIFCQKTEDIEKIHRLCKKVKQMKNRNIWVWTGYKWEDIISDSAPASFKQLLYCIDVLVDGPFEENKKNLNLMWKGSSNQRVILVEPTLQLGQLICAPDWIESK